MKPLVVDSLVQRVEDTEEYITRELQNYKLERHAMEDFIQKLHNHQFLKLEATGLQPEEIADACEWRLRPDETIPLRPIPKQLEGGSDFKALLTDPLFED